MNKLRTSIAIAISLFSILAASLIMSSCSSNNSSEGEFDSLSIVLGATQNVPELNEASASKISDEIKDYLTGLGRTKADLADKLSIFGVYPGNSNIKLNDLKLNELDLVDAQRKQYIESNAKKIIEFLKQSKPEKNGADYISATIKAYKKLDKKGEIIVYGSGLSDSGVLDFSTNLYLEDKFDPEDLAEKLLKDKKIREDSLDGATIKLVGFGESVDPQESLSENQKTKVEEIYTAIFDKMGAKKVVIIKGAAPSQDAKSVDTNFSVNPALTGELICSPHIYRFDDTSLNFEPDTANFSDESDALEVVNSLTEVLKQDKTGTRLAKIIGYQASISGERVPFSDLTKRRAESVRQLLIKNGIAANKISAESGGTGPNEFNENLDSQNNRFVEIQIQDECKNKE